MVTNVTVKAVEKKKQSESVKTSLITYEQLKREYEQRKVMLLILSLTNGQTYS